MPSILKSKFYTIAIIIAMVFFVDNLLIAQVNGANLLLQDTIHNNSLIYNTFIDSNSLFSYRKLYRLFERKKSKTSEVIEKQKSIERFVQYENKQIAEIQYLRLRAFGQSVYDLSQVPQNWIERVGNSLHIVTLKSIVEHNVLFKKNDLINSVDLIETEQLLRSRPYFEDALILVEPLQEDNKVRVIVITKDKFTCEAHLDFRNLDYWNGGICESSFFGTGLTFRADMYHDNELVDDYGYKFEMSNDNILGSFVSTDMYYRKGIGYDTKYVNFNRDFFSSKARIACGITFKESTERYKVYVIDSTISINYDMRDCWLGYSIPIRTRDKSKSPFLITIASKYREINYDEGLPTAVNLNPYFNSTKHYLVSLGFLRQNLYQSNLIYKFGSTEDIPVGFRIQFATGFEEDQFQRRYLVNGEITGADYFNVGYLYGSIQIGGYTTEHKHLEQSSLNISTTYISNLFRVSKLDIRQFVMLNYTKGLNRFMGEREYIVLGGSKGIRGLRSHNLVGTTRMVANLETMAYTPYKIWGFRMAYFVFCDMGLIGFKDDYFDNLYSGLGFGMRLHNENTVFPTVQFRLAYYPVIPDNASVSNYYLTSEKRRRFAQFRASEPRILPFE